MLDQSLHRQKVMLASLRARLGGASEYIANPMKRQTIEEIRREIKEIESQLRRLSFRTTADWDTYVELVNRLTGRHLALSDAWKVPDFPPGAYS